MFIVFFFLMIRRPPRSTQSRSSAASDVYKRQVPALPLSRDREKMNELQKSLAVYRMVFGQSRQEDLAAFLINCLNNESMDNLMIDLSPPSDEKGPIS